MTPQPPLKSHGVRGVRAKDAEAPPDWQDTGEFIGLPCDNCGEPIDVLDGHCEACGHIEDDCDCPCKHCRHVMLVFCGYYV